MVAAVVRFKDQGAHQALQPGLSSKMQNRAEKLKNKQLKDGTGETVKLLKRWKEGSDAAQKNKQEMLIAKMCNKDKEEASKLLLKLTREMENKGLLHEENAKKESLKKCEGGDRSLGRKKSTSVKRERSEEAKLSPEGKALIKGLVQQKGDSLLGNIQRDLKQLKSEKDFKRQGQAEELKSPVFDDCELLTILSTLTIIRVERMKMEKERKKRLKKSKIHNEESEFVRLKEEKVMKSVQRELVEEILSEECWKEKPPKHIGEVRKKFKKLWKKKVDEKLAQCKSKRRRSDKSKMGDINDNVVEHGSIGKEELIQEGLDLEKGDVKEAPGQEEVPKVAKRKLQNDAEEEFLGVIYDGVGETLAEEVVSEDDSTGDEDISEDLRSEEHDPGYTKWKLAYLESKLRELDEREALRTSIPKDCSERKTVKTRLSKVWICEESADKEVQMFEESSRPIPSKEPLGKEADMNEAVLKVSGAEEMELEEGIVMEPDTWEQFGLQSKGQEKAHSHSMSLPPGFLKGIIEACTREVPANSSKLAVKLPEVHVNVKVNVKRPVVQNIPQMVQKAPFKATRENVSSSEPDPSALEHLDLRPPESDYPPFTMMMHQQVIAFVVSFTNCINSHRWYRHSLTLNSRSAHQKASISPGVKKLVKFAFLYN